jgi:hypothetical protein
VLDDGRIKQIRLWSLRSLILHLCFWNTKEFCKALVGVPIKFLITQKEEDMDWN